MKLKRAGLAFAGAMLWSGVAMAQTVTYQVFFGDSLTDSGNSYIITGIPPVFGGPASSDAGRFSNGPMWLDYRSSHIGFYADLLLGQSLPAGTNAINFAAGGSQSGSEPLGPGGPGALTQINDYLSFVKAGSVPAVSPTTLYAIFTGGNDYTGYIGAGATGGAAGEQAVVSTVLGNVNSAIATLAKAGARQFIVFNQFDLGLVPLLRDPAQFGAAGALPTNAGQIATQLTDLNNGQIGQVLKTARAATGASIIEIDVNALYRDEFNNPAVWKLTNVTGTCVGLDFTTQTGLCQTAQQAAQLMFWQATHPSDTTHANIAALVAGTIQTVYTAPAAIAVQSRLALAAAQGNEEVVADRLAELLDHQVAAIADIGHANHRSDAEADRSGYGSNTTNGTAGISFRIAEPVMLGATVAYGRTNASLDGGLGSLHLENETVTAFAGYHRDAWTALLDIGGTNDDFGRIQRNSGFTPFPWASASTSGWTWSVGSEIRYAIEADHWVVSPIVGVRYDHVAIGAYQESGTRLLDLAVDRHDLSSLVARTGIRVEGKYDVGGVMLAPQIDLIYRHQFEGDDETIAADLSDGQPVDGMPGAGARGEIALRGELGVALSETIRAGVAYQHTIIHNDETDSRVDLNLTVSF